MTRNRVGVVGVGSISDIFISNMIKRFHDLDVVGCTARNADHVRAKAEQFNIRAMTMDEMFADPTIDIIVNLTPTPIHYQIIKRALESGKHVYTEKSLTDNYPQAKELVLLSEEKGLRLGSAPDTFLGSGVQTAVAAVENGMIGEVTGFSVMLNRGLELLYETLAFIRQPGGGIGYDYGIYALTALFSILGPAAEVCGFSQTNRPVRRYQFETAPPHEDSYTIENENVMAAAIRMRSGVLGSVTFNGDSVFPDRPYISIQGTKGLLQLPDPNQFGGNVIFTQGVTDLGSIGTAGDRDPILPVHHRYAEDSRGIGVAEMAKAIEEHRPHRASATLATHLLELLDGIVSSSQSQRYARMESTFDKPEALTGQEIF